MGRTHATGGKKAIVISSINIEALRIKLGAVDEDRRPLEIGLILVMDFGEDATQQDYHILSPTEFVKHYKATGVHLENGWKEVVAK